MPSLFKRLFRRQPPRSQGPDTPGLDALLDRSLESVRAASPDTHRQWARLQSRLSADQRPATASTWPSRLAAGLAVSAAVVATLVFVTSREPLTDRYVTERGEQTHVRLADSSEVTLNHTSELTVRRFGEGEPRRMTMSGEALFRVRRNETPFIVSNGSVEVEVLGTEFNVRSRDGVLDVAVLHGTVRVSSATQPSGTSLTLTAGQRARVEHDRAPVRVDDISSPEFPGWMHGKLFLTRASLDEACREIGSRFDVAVRTARSSSITITGVLEASSADAALRSLSLLTGMELRKDHDAYVLE